MAKKTKTEEGKFFKYKGRPLVRCGDVVYYGDLNDKYITKINIISNKDFKDIKMSEDVVVQLISTDTENLDVPKIAKTSKKKGLYAAIDIADAWLERANR